MKSTYALSALSLLGLVAAQPAIHGRRRAHQHAAHAAKRDENADWVTVVNYVTDENPSVTVYVDAAGHTVSVDGETATATASTTATAAAGSSANTVVSPVNPVATAASNTGSSGGSSSSGATSTGSSSSSSATSASSLKGIVYSPYQGVYGSTSCKTTAEINEDLAVIVGKGYNLIRLYGVDCNQVAAVNDYVKSKGIKLFLGTNNVVNGGYSADIASMATQLGNDWSNVHTVAIGNELVNAGTASAATVVAAVKDVKDNILNKESVSVVTVDTWVAVMANPSLCEASDYAAVNMHPWFDGGVAASGTSTWMANQVANTQAKCGSKSVVVTETGWPTQGTSNGDAVAGTTEQATAIAGIKSGVTGGLIILTAFNDMWKDPSANGGIEPYFGLNGNAPSYVA